METGLANRVVLVTGAPGGISGEVVRAFVAEGALTRSLKNELTQLAPRGRINVVAPGWTLTPRTVPMVQDAARVRRVLQTVPLRKVARPHEVANAIIFLASSRLSGHLTGQILTLAGGMEGRVLYQPEQIDPTTV